MKKTFWVTALVTVAFGSWAFYPKPAAPAEYMELSLREVYGTHTLVMILPTGEINEQKLDVRGKSDYRYRGQLILRLNELRAQGWTVAQQQESETVVPDARHPQLSPDFVRTTTYLLEKP
ncbi:hypothetical protein [Hymenobacter cellulosivorans]|uniref:Uncharacterized protein n=1 Tax=Hymenobacter cellulosivorans TaxID=2932249 RepID=A0ABY4FBA7_9BACT|nr:hypothetical protein [Hymenobacter cellulosivorans]UOQ53219.1 hypothetical protein MUN80_00310 [Hymenobacter cellulosivorans]